MAVHYLGDNNPDGMCVGTSPTELVSFHGASPSAQGALTALATGATIATAVASIQEILAFLATKGLATNSLMARIAFVAANTVPEAVLARHRRHARGLGLPEVGSGAPAGIPLAVVGGGHSAAAAVDELRAWPGEIWAINGAFHWCRNHGIAATFYAMDPLPAVAALAAGAERAVLADTCHPDVFQALAGAPVRLARTGRDALLHDCTAAATAPMLAAADRYAAVTLFGCEGSFPDGRTHAYKDVPGSRLRVRCGGADYLTSPDLVMQSEFLAQIARGVNGWLTVAGAGFLPALIEHGDYAVTHVTQNLMDALNERNTACSPP